MAPDPAKLGQANVRHGGLLHKAVKKGDWTAMFLTEDELTCVQEKGINMKYKLHIPFVLHTNATKCLFQNPKCSIFRTKLTYLLCTCTSIFSTGMTCSFSLRILVRRVCFWILPVSRLARHGAKSVEIFSGGIPNLFRRITNENLSGIQSRLKLSRTQRADFFRKIGTPSPAAA